MRKPIVLTLAVVAALAITACGTKSEDVTPETEAFTLALRDTQLAYQQGPNGDYSRVRRGNVPRNLHNDLMKLLG